MWSTPSLLLFLSPNGPEVIVLACVPLLRTELFNCVLANN